MIATRSNPVLFYIIVCMLLHTVPGWSQTTESNDKVVMTNGEENIGQVTEIGDDFIKFKHKGEALVYTYKKVDINKIQFASGRIEFYNGGQPNSNSSGNTANAAGLQSHHNVVAILPFTYIGSGGSRDDKMGLKAQSDCYNLLKQSVSQLTIQDPLTTNAMLAKQGVNEGNVTGFTPGELANIVGSEYVLFCTITINQTGTSTTSGNYYSGKDKGKKATGFGVGTSNTTANFNTSLDMKIYNDQNQNIFAKTHESFWPSEDAYQLTLQYLLKRSPLYKK